jgi:hypothetical protein
LGSGRKEALDVEDWAEIRRLRNLVGTYSDLVELMVLAEAGKVTLHTRA